LTVHLGITSRQCMRCQQTGSKLASAENHICKPARLAVLGGR
jgi:hypothetical protein